ncbi:mitochondrial import receptor subunit tom20 [Rhodotorula toruloides]
MDSYSPSSSLRTGLKIAGAVVGTIAVGTVAYAAYWDHKRRTDPEFRRKIQREHKKLEKKVKQKQEVGKEQVKAALTRALALVNAEKVPETAEGKEQFFMEQVALGEQLAARSPEFYVASAISFYKALKVYPAPQELLMIYQKTQPPAVFDLVMELISLEINAAASAASASSGPSSSSTEPLLQEVEGASGSSSTTAVPAAATAGSENGEDSSPSSGGSFVHVETDAVVTPEGDVAAEETTAIVADIEVEQTGEETPTISSEEIDPPEPTLA